ncbi:MAG: PAS domain S-box protein, partial [Methanomethylovorans sp.]|nr:PAS domain S-box protein [Methanomethylovorans sp.]
KSFLCKIPVESIPWLYGKLLDNQTVFIPDADLLPPEAKKEKELIRFFNASALIFYPVFSENHLSECILLDYAKEKLLWQEDSIALLQIVGENISSALKRKRAYQMLRKERDMAQRYLDIAGVMILVLDTHGKVVLINRKGTELLGYAAEEVLEKDWVETFVPETDQRRLRDYINTIVAMDPPSPEYYVNGVLTKNGDIRTVAWNSVILNDDAGNFSGILASAEDITDFLKAKNKLQESEKKYHTYVDSAPICIFVSDIGGKLIEVNKEACRFSGYSEKELLSSSFEKIIVAGEREYVPLLFSDVAANGSGRKGMNICRKDGTQYPTIIDIVCTYDNKFLIFCTDVTELKKVEEKLAFTSFSVERSSTPTFWIGTDGWFIDVNDATCAATGYSREELLQMDVNNVSSHLISAPLCGAFENAVEHTKKQGTIRFEVMFKRKNGSEFPVEINLDHFSFNEMDFLIAFASDITERKKIEDTIKGHLHFLETMLDTIPHPVFYKDTEGRYTGCNSIFAESIIGLPREYIVGRTMHELQAHIPQHLAGIYKAHDLELIQQHGTQFYESRVHCADGKLRYYLFSKSTFNDPKGDVAGIIGVMLDITERKESEGRLRRYAAELEKANEELKSLDRMKDEFIANVNHELRTPLISIMGFSDALNSGLLGDITEDQKKAINAVLRNAKRLNRLVDSILHMNRIRSSDVNYDMTIFQFADMLSNIITDLSLQMDQKGIILQQDIQEDLPMINGDRNALERVVINLLENSIKFTPYGGEIKVSLRKEDRYLHVTVSDTGIGIPKDKLAEVFERFYQVDSSSTRVFGGLGIGLHISKNIVEAHGGEIWANSDGESGTSFHVLLLT